MKNAPFQIYSASAGSGKTFTLVKEYLKICLTDESNLKFIEILAITFTNKAAAEMKERIIQSLISFSGFSPTDQSSAEMMRLICEETGLSWFDIKAKSASVFQSILHNYSRLSINTIDSFTHRVIRTFANDLGLSPNFEIELDGALLKEQAVDLLISRAGEKKELTKLLVSFMKDKAKEDKSWLIEKDFYNVAKELFNEISFEHCDKLKRLTIKDFLRIKKSILSFTRKIDIEFALIGSTFSSEMLSMGINPSWILGGSRGVVKYFLYLKEGIWRKYTPNKSVKKIILSESWSSTRTPTESFEVVERFRSKMIRLWKKVEELLREYPKYIHLKLVDGNFYNVAVLNEIRKEISQIKDRKNIVPISEFNKKINDVLENEDGNYIYERLGDKYVNFFIDEFQDTSLLQWKNLLPLINNAIAGGKKMGSTMIVGDAKQAIYRWRGGDVDQFLDLQTRAKLPPNNPIYHTKLVSLDKNFRSRSEIVEFNNSFFSFISEKITKDKHASLYNNLKATCVKGGGGLVSFSFVEKTKKYGKMQSLSCIEKIESLIREGFNYADLCVLTRTKKQGGLIVKELSDVGIPVISSESLLLKESPEVRFIINFLRYMNEPEHPKNRFRLVSFLRNRGLCFGEEENTHSQLKLLCVVSKRRFERFLSSSLLGFNPSLWSSLSLMELCHKIIKSTNLNDTAQIYMQFLLEEVWSYETKYARDIRGFLEYWESQSGKLSVSIPETVDAIKVMTIHKSKGLEFPVVLFPFADWNIWKEIEPKAWIKNNYQELKDLPNSLISINNLLLFGSEQLKNLHLENKSSVLLDNINILYVALTRAEKRLYILSSTQFDLNKKRLSSLFKSFLEKEGLWTDGCGDFLLGKKVSPESPFFPKVNLIHNTQTIKDFNSVLRLSGSAPKNWSVNAPIDSTEKGDKVHKILSYINYEKDLEPAIEKALGEGLILNEDLIEMHNLLKKVIGNQTLKPYFSENFKVKNECEIILSTGKTIIPDRLVFNGNSAHVFDYKTGVEHEVHINQIKKYKETLSHMGFKVKESFLVYLKKTSIKLVCVD